MRQLSNPINKMALSVQKIIWTHIKDNPAIMIHLELLLPFKAIPKAYLKGGYISYPAEVIEDCVEPGLTKGDYIIIDFPLITFERAFNLLSIKDKRLLREDENIDLVFIRKSDKIMMIKSAISKAPLDWHIEKAKEFYETQVSEKPYHLRDKQNGHRQDTKATEEY